MARYTKPNQPRWGYHLESHGLELPTIRNPGCTNMDGFFDLCPTSHSPIGSSLRLSLSVEPTSDLVPRLLTSCLRFLLLSSHPSRRAKTSFPIASVTSSCLPSCPCRSVTVYPNPIPSALRFYRSLSHWASSANYST